MKENTEKNIETPAKSLWYLQVAPIDLLTLAHLLLDKSKLPLGKDNSDNHLLFTSTRRLSSSMINGMKIMFTSSNFNFSIKDNFKTKRRIKIQFTWSKASSLAASSVSSSRLPTWAKTWSKVQGDQKC